MFRPENNIILSAKPTEQQREWRERITLSLCEMKIPQDVCIGPSSRAMCDPLIVLIERQPELRGLNQSNENRKNSEAMSPDLHPDVDSQPVGRFHEKKCGEKSAGDEYDSLAANTEQMHGGLKCRQMLRRGRSWDVVLGVKFPAELLQ